MSCAAGQRSGELGRASGVGEQCCKHISMSSSQQSVAPPPTIVPGTHSEWSKEGFALVHRAVVQKNNIRIEKLLSISPLSLEAKTADRFKLTPLLVAAKYGCVDTLHFLLKLGANSQARSSRGHNAIQCALTHSQYEVVSSLLPHPQFTVMEDMFSTLASEALQVHELASALQVLNGVIFSHVISPEKDREVARLYEQQIQAEGGIEGLISLVDRCLQSKEMLDQVGPILARIMQNLCYSDALCEAMLASSLPERQMELMGSMDSPEGITALIDAASLLVRQGSVERMMTLHAARTCMDAVRRTGSEEVMKTAITCMLQCADNPEVAHGFHKDGILRDLIGQLNSHQVSPQIKSLIVQILTKIASVSEHFRKVILRSEAVEVALSLLNKKSKLIMIIIDLLRVMCAKRGDTESIINQSKLGVNTLIYVIKYSISTQHQHKAFEILWLIAGEDLQERRALASLVGPMGLIRMLEVTDENNLLTAATALHLLSPPHHDMQLEIVENGAIYLLLQVVQTSSPQIQLMALSIMENCSHDIGFRPIEALQYAFMHEKGIQTLLKLQVHTKSVEVRLQALSTLASVSIGSIKIKRAIVRDPLFSVRRLIRSLTEMIGVPGRLLLAMRGLSYLAYNSLEVQTVILNTKPLPMQPFRDLLTSADSKTGSEAAFYAIVLARVFEETSIQEVELVAECIRYLVHTLKKALEVGEDELQMHICTFVSGLLHMRAGICHAFIAADFITLLVQVIFTPFEHCRKTAAIALSYISRDKKGGRLVLACCRKNERLYDKIVEYSTGYLLGRDFVERWRRYQETYLSSGSQGRRLTSRRTSNVISLAFKGAKLFSE